MPDARPHDGDPDLARPGDRGRDRRDDPGPVLEEARDTAASAADRAGLVVHEIDDHRRAEAASALLDTVWARETGSVLSPEALVAIAHAGGQVTTAEREGRLVGVTAAFLGRLHRERATFLHSHVTGVLPGDAGQGVGRALKWHQRAWCLARGIDEVRWTFDPLVRRNAVLNLVLLGARAASYERDVYGPMADARNAGFPTDRLVVSWDLDSPRTRAAANGRAAAPDLEALRRAGAQPLLEDRDERPIVTSTSAPRRLVQIPADIESIRARDRELGAAWSTAVRSTLGEALRSGARVSGITRDGWYVLAPSAGVTELTET